MDKNEDEKPVRDERTIRLLKKYFAFFKQKGYLPKKWISHILDHMDQFFAYRDEIAEEVAEKDASMDALSIDQLLSVFETLADQWQAFSESMDAILENQETARGQLQSRFDDLYNSLDQVLKDIEDGDWYNPVDFCVYCETDNSLTFYYGKVPDIGETYNGKRVTAVFSSFSTNIYSSQSSVPWERYSDSITDVVFSSTYATVQPISLSYWFYGFESLLYMDLTYLDTRSVTDATSFAVLCSSLVQIKVGDNTEIFTRFYNLVSQECWYTSTSLASSSYMYGVTSAGTYYSYSPVYSGEIRAIVPAGFTDEIIFTMGSSNYVLSNINSYAQVYSVPMYDGAVLVDYESVSVSMPDGYTYEIIGSVSSGYDITILTEYDTITVSADLDYVEDDLVPSYINITISLSDGSSVTGTLSAETGWTVDIPYDSKLSYNFADANVTTEDWFEVEAEASSEKGNYIVVKYLRGLLQFTDNPSILSKGTTAWTSIDTYISNYMLSHFEWNKVIMGIVTVDGIQYPLSYNDIHDYCEPLELEVDSYPPTKLKITWTFDTTGRYVTTEHYKIFSLLYKIIGSEYYDLDPCVIGYKVYDKEIAGDTGTNPEYAFYGLHCNYIYNDNKYGVSFYINRVRYVNINTLAITCESNSSSSYSVDDPQGTVITTNNIYNIGD